MAATLEQLIREDDTDGFLVNRDIYRDPEVFEWEMRYLFEGTWNLLGLESQIRRPHDYFTTHIGRAPVIVTRDGGGQVHCLLNTCRHKGAMVCHMQQGNARTFVCQYHGWAYDAGGRNILIKDKDQGAYPECFDRIGHDLEPVRVGVYRGFILGILNPDVPPL